MAGASSGLHLPALPQAPAPALPEPSRRRAQRSPLELPPGSLPGPAPRRCWSGRGSSKEFPRPGPITAASGRASGSWTGHHGRALPPSEFNTALFSPRIRLERDPTSVQAPLGPAERGGGRGAARAGLGGRGDSCPLLQPLIYSFAECLLSAAQM